MKTHAKILHILSWIPAGFLRLLLMIAGLVVVPFALLFKASPRLPIWGNREENTPPWFIKKTLAERHESWWKDFRAEYPNFWWYAIRNPTNNFRYLFEDRLAQYAGSWPHKRMSSLDLEHGRRTIDRWAYNGMFAGYRRLWLNDDGTYSEIWFGWKVGSDIEGMGFTVQRASHKELGT